MQLAVYTASLANQGTRYKATFLKRIVSSDYTETLVENEPVVANDYTFSDEAMARCGRRYASGRHRRYGFHLPQKL